MCNEVSTDQECIREKDSVLRTSTHMKLRERKRGTARWQGIVFSFCAWLKNNPDT